MRIRLSAEKVIANFRLREKLGTGSMAEVFLAEMVGPAGFGKLVALKRIHPHLAASEGFVASLISEARIGGNLNHPNIVQTIELGQDGDSYFLAMEYVPGTSLATLLDQFRRKRKQLPLPLVLDISRQIAAGLAYAHTAADFSGRPLRIVHRDLKPANILVSSFGTAKIADFGVARATSNLVKTMESWSVKGTIAYMSPEQAAGEDVDHRSDLFSLGAILFELLTLEKLYFDIKGLSSLEKVERAEIAHRLSLLEPFPRAVSGLVARMLARDREARPGSAAEVGGELMAIVATQPACFMELGEIVRGVLAERSSKAQQGPKIYFRRSQGPSSGEGAVCADATTMVPVPSQPEGVHRQRSVSREAISARSCGTLEGSTGRECTGAPAERRDAPYDSHRNLPETPTSMPVPSRGSSGQGGEASPIINRRQSMKSEGEGGPRPPTANHAWRLLWFPAAGLLAVAFALVFGDWRSTAPQIIETAPVSGVPEMVFVAGGTFMMGSRRHEVLDAYAWCQLLSGACRLEVYEREQPRREVTLSPFYMDSWEVTNVRFAEWLNSLGGLEIQDDGRVLHNGLIIVDLHPAFSQLVHRGGRFHSRKRDDHKPVTQVTWYGANLYCRSQGKALPTEAQWEFASRGESGRPFPWGTRKPTCGGVTFGRGEGGACDAQESGAVEVGTSMQDTSPAGICDLGGNVSEWTADGFRETYPPCSPPCVDPVEPPAEMYVIRGGNWNLPAEACRAQGRGRAMPDLAAGNLGLRCVLTVMDGAL